MLIHETPSCFAKMVADIATTDKFKTADGSIIEVPLKSVKATSNESSFPPTSGSRSWLGHISDVAMANVFWQRQTVDTYGQQVPKGSLRYEEISSQYNGDNGERIYKYDGGKIAYELRERGQNVLARSPELTPSNLGAVLGQITGRQEKNRIISHKDVYPENTDGATTVTNKEEFEKELSQGLWPKIITVHTTHDPFWHDSGYGAAGGAGGRTGAWHVVVATGYDARTKRLAIDNSWQPEHDHYSPMRQVSSDAIFAALSGPRS
jgi:hypothetical protein